MPRPEPGAGAIGMRNLAVSEPQSLQHSVTVGQYFRAHIGGIARGEELNGIPWKVRRLPEPNSRVRHRAFAERK